MGEGKGHTELLPCPFCGSINVDPAGWSSLEQYKGTEQWRSGPACDGCGASADSAEKWNTRTPAVEGLVKALEAIEPFIPQSSAADGGPNARSAHVAAADQVRSALSRFRSLQNGGAE